jgi:tRNA pseudouridine55 synthase
MTSPAAERACGWLVLDKPGGMTSMRALTQIKRLVRGVKVGHAGTLDPLATGVLPVAVGEATKTIPFVMGGAKRYRFTVCWGEARATDDVEGEVTATSSARPTERDIGAALPDFEGEVMQTPPAFSAIKVKGQRAYRLARAGTPAVLAARPVRVDSFTLVECEDRECASFEVRCGKGVYVRALARDLATRLGTLGHVVALRRTQAGPFEERDAISLDNLPNLGHSTGLGEMLLPLRAALAELPTVEVSSGAARQLRHGQAVDVGGVERGVVYVTAEGRPLALARIEGGVARPERIFNT